MFTRWSEPLQLLPVSRCASRGQELEDATKNCGSGGSNVDLRAKLMAGGAPNVVFAASLFPLGFKSVEEFLAFGANLINGLRAAGYTDAEAAVTGSSITGVKFTTGQPFDVGRVSDYDVAVISKQLLNKVKEAGIGLRGRGTRSEPLDLKDNPEDLESVGLTNLAEELTASAGRPVNFMVYDSLDSLAARGAPYIAVPKSVAPGIEGGDDIEDDE